jgi:hypothetical protein
MFRMILKDLRAKILEYAAPKLGHAQAGTIPDEPFRKWEHKDSQGRRYDISNSQRALDAAQNCYMVLLKFLRRFPNFALNPSMPWQEMVDVISDLFETEGELDHRVQAWQKAISDGRFGFVSELKDKALTYDDREWFRKAVKVIEGADEPDHYERQEGFENSNWKYFHDAAAFQRFTILHEVLPDYGIICG